MPTDQFSEHLTKGKFTEDDINTAEMTILKQLNFKISETNIFDFIERLVQKLFVGCPNSQ